MEKKYIETLTLSTYCHPGSQLPVEGDQNSCHHQPQNSLIRNHQKPCHKNLPKSTRCKLHNCCLFMISYDCTVFSNTNLWYAIPTSNRVNWQKPATDKGETWDTDWSICWSLIPSGFYTPEKFCFCYFTKFSLWSSKFNILHHLSFQNLWTRFLQLGKMMQNGFGLDCLSRLEIMVLLNIKLLYCLEIYYYNFSNFGVLFY